MKRLGLTIALVAGLIGVARAYQSADELLDLYESSPAELQAALDAGANPNARNRDGTPAMIVAIDRGHPEAIRMLGKAGGNPNALWIDDDHRPLIVSISLDNFEMVDALLDVGANPNAGISVGNALHLAIYMENVAIVERLLEAGADPGILDAYGHTPLDLVKETRNKAIERLLIRATR